MEIQDGNMEVFDAYMRGQMSVEEVRTFEQRLEKDSEFAAEFIDYKRLVDGVREHFSSELKQELEALDAEMDEKSGIRESSSLKRLAWVSSGIAASLLIGLCAYSIFGQTDTIELAHRYWPVEEGLPVKMSSKGKYDEAMNAFKQEHWGNSLQLLQQVSPKSDTVDYFLGVVFFNLQKYDDASRILSSISRESVWYDECQFRLALAYLAAGKMDESQAVLREILDSDSPYKESASAVMNEI